MMRKFLIASLLFALACAPAYAEKLPFFQGDGQYKVGAHVDDGGVALILKYIGSEENGQVDGNATGDILLLDGDLGAEAADAQVTSNCGAVAGTLDVSDADCDTIGELVYEINNSQSGTQNWLAVLVDYPPNVDAGASALVFTDPGSAQNAKLPQGYAVTVDSSALDDEYLGLTVQGSRYAHDDMRNWVAGGPDGTSLIDQGSLWENMQTYLIRASIIFGDADAGTSTFDVHCLNMDLVTSNSYEAQTPITAYSEPEATDDTVIVEDYSHVPIACPVGYRMWISVQQAGDTLDATNAIRASYFVGKPE